MLKKKDKKPLYYKKSKAAKRMEQEEFSESEESFTETQSEYRNPQRRRRGVTLNRDYEYSGTEEQYDDKPYGYWSSYDKDNDMYSRGNEMYSTENNMYDDYTTQGSSYHQPRKPQGRNKHYATSETEFSNESDSDCVLCPKGEGRRRKHPQQVNRGRLNEPPEYMSEYSYKGQQQRHKQKQNYGSTKRKNRPDDTTETENPYPYTNDVNVYLARNPIGHRAFQYKRHEQTEGYTTQSDTESASEDESDKEVSRRVMKGQSQRQPQYQVYATQVGQAPAVAFQKQGREKLLSVTDYDGNVPMMALRDKMQNGVNRTESGIVYLPVIVMDNGGKMHKNKIMTTHSLIDKNDEQAEKPLETNMQVYAATDIGQGNIFEQANKGSNTSKFEQSKKGNDDNIYDQTKKSSDGKNLEPPLTQNITIFTVDPDQANPLKQTASRIHNKSEENKEVPPQSDYPVQRSYINVAPSKVNPESNSDKKKTKAKGVLSGTSLRSLLARARPGRSKSPKPKKEKKGKKDKKDKSKSQKSKEILESASSEPIAVVDLSKEEEKQLNKEAQTPSLRPNNSILPGISAKVIHEPNKLIKPPYTENDTYANIPPNNNTLQEDRKNIKGDKKGERSSIVGGSHVIPASTGGHVGETRKSLAIERRKSTNWDRLRDDIVERPNILEEQPQNPVGQRQKSITQERPRSVLGERHKIPTEQQTQIISGERQKSINEEQTKSVLGERQKSINKERQRSIIGERFENKDVEQGKHMKVEEGKNQKNINNILRKSEPTIQPSREEIQKLASEPIHKTESNVMQPEKKSLLSRMLGKKKKDSKEHISQIQPNSKQLLAPIPENFDNYPYTSNGSPPTSPKPLFPLNTPHHTVTMDPSAIKKKNSRSSQITKNLSALNSRRDTTGYRYQGDWTNDQEKQPLRLWGYNLPFLVYVFQAAQFFLGLTLHDKFMEVMHVFLYNDDT